MTTTTELPGRYRVAQSYLSGRPYLDDGSNFVAWVDGLTPTEILSLAHADTERKDGYTRDYVAALAAGGDWRHAGCDHAYGICSG